MNFDKILEYQGVDKELLALENEVAKCPERARLLSANSKVNGAVEAIGKLSSEAADLINNYAKLKEKLDEINEKLNDFDGITEGVEEVGEADHYLKLIDGITADLAALEREALRDGSRIDGVGSDYKKIWEVGIRANEEYKQAKSVFDAVIAERQPRVDELRKQLAAIAKEIPDEILQAYLRLRAAKKNPVLVPYEPSTQTCKGCGLELSSAARGKLKASGDHAECPNCGRMIYMP